MKRRSMRREWVENIRAQCADAHVPFFFKQWGGVWKKDTGRVLNGRTYDEMPTRVFNQVPNAAERKRLVSEIESRAAAWSSDPVVPLRLSPRGQIALF